MADSAGMTHVLYIDLEWHFVASMVIFADLGLSLVFCDQHIWNVVEKEDGCMTLIPCPIFAKNSGKVLKKI